MQRADPIFDLFTEKADGIDKRRPYTHTDLLGSISNPNSNDVIPIVFLLIIYRYPQIHFPTSICATTCLSIHDLPLSRGEEILRPTVSWSLAICCAFTLHK